MTEQEKLINERLDKFEKKYDAEIKSLNEQQVKILTEIAKFEPILNRLCENVEKISSNAVDKKRIEDLETDLDNEREKFETYKKETDLKINKLENAEANKALKLQNKIMGLVVAAIVAYILGIITNEYTNIRNHNINNQNKEVVENVSK